MTHALLSLIPPLIVVLVAIKTRKPFEAMILGTVIGFAMVGGTNFLTMFTDSIVVILTDPSLVWIILFTCLIGGLLGIIEAARTSKAFTKLALKYATNEKKTFLMTLVMALAIFPDEILRTLTLSSAMKGVSDKNKIPREMFAYALSAVGVPIAVLLPMTSWTIYFGSLMEGSKLTEPGTGMDAFMNVMPYSFYPMFVILVFILVVFGVIPKIGGIKAAYNSIKEGTYDLSKYKAEIEQEEFEEEKTVKLIDFLLPLIGLFVATVLSGNNLMVGVTVAILVAGGWYVLKKYVDFETMMEAFWEGYKSMIFPMAIVVVAFSLAEAMNLLGFADVIYMLKPYLIPEVLPLIAFIISAVLCYLTGEFWGIPAILLPAMLPLVQAFDVNVWLYCAAIFSGSAFGSQTCVYGDLNAVISETTGVKLVDVALNVTPYAIITGILSGITFLIVGFIV